MAKIAGLRARKINERGVGIEVADALQERREIGIGERDADRFDDLAAGLDEAGLERRLRFDAGRPVVDQRDDTFAAVLGRPFGHDPGLLAEQEAGAHHVGRFGNRDRGARAHDQGRDFGFGHQRRDRERRRRDADADEADFVVDDHLLDDAARIVGNAAVVAHDELDLSPGDHVAVLLHVKLDRGLQAAGRRR